MNLKKDVCLKIYWLPIGTEKLSELKPNEVIDDFFSSMELESIQESLWEMLKSMMKDLEFQQKNATHYIHLYERVSDLITACYIKKLRKQEKG